MSVPPGVDQPHAATIEIREIAGGERGPVGGGDGGYLRVELGNWTPQSTTPGGNLCESRAAGSSKQEDAAGEILGKHGLSFAKQPIATLSPGKKFDSVKKSRRPSLCW